MPFKPFSLSAILFCSFYLLYFSPGLRGAGAIYYILLSFSFVFVVSLLFIRTYARFSSAAFFLVLFYFQSLIWLSPSLLVASYAEFLQAFSRIFLVMLSLAIVLFLPLACRYITILYLVAVLVACFSIYIQYVFGPLDWLLSEAASTRSSLARFSSTAGNTIILSAAIPFAITIFEDIISNCSSRSFYRYLIRVLQVFLFATSFLTLSRTSIGLSAISLCFVWLRNSFIILFSRFFPLQTLQTNVFSLRRNFLVFATVFPFFVLMFAFFSEQISVGLQSYSIQSSFLPSSQQKLDTNDVFTDLFTRLTWFRDLNSSLLTQITGSGSYYYGGTLGFAGGYSHNTYLDIYYTQGIAGLFLFGSFLIFCLFQSPNPSTLWLRLSLCSIFLVSATHNSGLLFHPLWYFPLLISIVPLKKSV
jgi:hypothetical protein